ncbi:MULTISPECIES: (2Fe-2S)-binding protein [Streptomyces]|uniref:(2Fe-2S)-binding protein n=1 Tax=Streptomyces TaxID=1883 RepID=UPI00163BF23F|nr:MULTISPECIES: (2Fe-2S)-binding protein [Streptomyces]MBC2874193.1 (2Fe-2S)-binding protein [Streptomyces sp. TYQ1024]UBI40235.1 (2Fe-2S)-binding protein [Streptomyces mobaraensis]UKW32813.1 (2Fe-2S)-binding protein [Streptomyces sp. TYQ1024]
MTTATAPQRAVPDTHDPRGLHEETYAGLADALGPLLRLRVAPAGPVDGLTADRLVRDPAAREHLRELAGARMRDAGGRDPRPDVAAMDALHLYAFHAAVAMSGPWFLERRVPLFTPGGIGCDPAAATLSVLPSALLCLPDDPAAGRPGVRVVSDEERLAAALREAVARHLAPVLEAFRPLLRRGPRAVWGLATDELAESVWYVGRATGDEGRAARAADALLPGGTPPYVGAAGFRPCGGDAGAAAGAGTDHTRTRVNCCLWYTVTPDRLCGTCPRRTDV